ncbi:MAG: Nramp family divalent metal transporter [Thermoprotei archaeon]
MESQKVKLGVGPEVEVDELPDPPQLNLRGVLRIIGPSAIVLGVSIGSGEWLIGPSSTILYGPFILWIATVSILLQTILNLEMVRYTMYSGEPIFNGMMRLPPGKTFWAPFLTILSILERAWPAWAFAAATALTAAFIGKIPGDAEAFLVMVSGIILLFICVGLVSVGGVVERALELAQWVMIFLIIGMLIIIDALVVPSNVALNTFIGFFTFGYLAPGASIILLGALAGYAGAGGLNNTTVSNYYRDKGFAMGAKVGAIPTLIKGKKISVSPTGKVFKVTEENLRKWSVWRKLSIIDIVGIFTLGAFIGMYLPNALALALIPSGTRLPAWGVAAYQGNTLAAKFGPIGWAAALLAGFWILFSTQLGSTDMITRTLVDMTWQASDKIRKWTGNDIRKLYYIILTVIVLWAIFAFVLTYGFKIQPLIWILLVANMSNIVLGVTGLATIYINSKWLPKALRPSILIRILLLIGVIFWFTFAFLAIGVTFFGLKI